MHDLLHELAQSVSTQECFRFVGDDESLFLEIPETIRHLSVETSNFEVLKKVERFKNLRTLHIIDEYDSNLFEVLTEIFKVIRSIRLLHLNYSFVLKMMPEEVGYLHHLRYLRFSVLNVKLLPRSISSLYHLQFIIIDDNQLISFSDDYFLRDMNNLSNLRYLSYSKNFLGIGKLKFLKVLNEFNIKNENGYRIEELEHMNDLRYLNITNLKDVRDVEEAYNAKLCDKRKLTELSLNWNREEGGIAYSDLDERVLDKLQPHNYLKILHIHHYMGVRSAIWMNEMHLINNLEKIYLSECFVWEILPPFGQLPFLKTLCLQGMPNVKQHENKFHGNGMCYLFPSLEELSLSKMEALVDWFDASVVDGFFPCLTFLFLCDSPNLQELPYLPPKLQTLIIHNIGWKALNYRCSISKSIPLKTLEVHQCPNMTSISVEGEIGKLEKLIIQDLQSLQSLPCSLTNIISSLEFVVMKMLPQLQEYPELPLPFIKIKMKKPKFRPDETMLFTIDDEQDYRFEDLEHMNEIRILNIYNLEYVRDAEEACNATQLSDKRKLVQLSLNWSMTPDRRRIVDCELDERVLDNLQPHNYLKTISITKYMGARSPIWMNEVQLINNLEDIILTSCLEWEILPPFGQLPFLRTLQLQNMPKVKQLENKFHGNDMCSVFPSLQYLDFKDMEALVDWFDASVVDSFFPCLTTIRLSNCTNLQELPYLPPKLESLQIRKIGWKTMNCCSSSRSIPLEILEVLDCPNITSISLEGEICKLEKMAIADLPSLQSFPSSLANISSLEFLHMAKLPQLQEYPDLPPSLKNFHFS